MSPPTDSTSAPFFWPTQSNLPPQPRSTNSGPEAYATAGWFFGSWFGILVMFGYTWVLLHHMMGGIRHLIWDTGALMDKVSSTKLAIATGVTSVSLTLLVWAVALMAR